jgi:cell division protein FtsA
VESDAERLKITYGSAIMIKDKNVPGLSDTKDGINIREINTVVEARTREIVENVYRQVKCSKVMDSLGAGIYLAGGSSVLNNLQELGQEKLRQEVRFSTIQKEWMENEDERMGNPLYMTAISLLIKGTENCVRYVPPPAPDPRPVEEPVKPDEGGRKKGGKKKGEEDSKGRNFFDKLFDSIVNQD